MNILLNFRHACVALLLTVGFLGLLTPLEWSWVLLGVAGILLPEQMPDLADAAMRRWVFGVGLRGLAVLVVAGVVYVHPLLSADAEQRVFHHPAFVLPLWLLSLGLLHRHWRRQRGLVEAQPVRLRSSKADAFQRR